MSEQAEINWTKVKNIFENVTERMGKNPDSPAIGAPKAKVRVIRERLFEATAEEHTSQIDEPVERGGCQIVTLVCLLCWPDHNQTLVRPTLALPL